MTTKKKKSAKQRRVLIVALIVAVAIVAASTFAWFSSKDEVTNRLTASANYNVSIVEDFQPPADWLPGQTINKDVAAVNTGNVDAFVRMWLDGKLRLLKEDAVDSEILAKASVENVLTPTADIKAVTDPARTKLGLNFYKKSGNTITYYKTLSTDKIDNPNDINHSTNNNAGDEANNAPAAFSEVQSMQAAGILAYAPTGAKYSWTLEQAEDLYVRSNNATNLQTVAAGTKVGTTGSTASTIVVPTGTSTAGNYYGAIDASTFQPETTGLYLFKRNIGDTADGTANTYEYSGYYFVKAGDANVPNSITKDTYFALHTETAANKHSDYVVPASAVVEDNTIAPTADLTLPVNPSGVKLFSATENVYDKADGLIWKYNGTAGSEKFTVTHGTDDDAVTIEIALANIGTAADKWTAIAPSGSADSAGYKTTFYYTNDLEAGDTTRKLVDNVTLSSDTKVGAYLAFDFDLNVFLDSVQITLTEEKGESDVTIENGWAVDNVYNEDGTNGYDHSGITAAKGVADNGDVGEINTVTWSIFTGS